MFYHYFPSLKIYPWLYWLVVALCFMQGRSFGQKSELKPAIHNYNVLPPANTAKEIKQVLKKAQPLQFTGSDSAVAIYKHALTNSIKLKYYFGAAAASIGLGNVYKNKSMFVESQKASEDAIYYSKQDKESQKLLALAYNNAGRSAKELGDYKDASEYFYKAADAIEKIPSSQLMIETIYTNLGGILDDDSLALGYFKKVEDIARQKKDMYGLGQALLNMSYSFDKMHDYRNSERKLKDALALGRQQKDTLLIRRAFIKLAANSLNIGDPAKALKYLNEGEKTGLDENIFYNNAPRFSRSEVYVQLGDYKRAEQYAKLGLTVAQQYNLREQICEGYRMLAFIYGKVGKYKLAYDTHVRYLEIKDSIKEESMLRNNQILQARYQISQKDKSLSQQQLQILKQQRILSRNRIMMLSVGIGAALLCCLFFFVQRNYRNKQRLLLKSQELSQLKAMIKGEEKERSRIARELHDGVGGMLVAINMNLGMINKDHPHAGLGRIEGMLDDAGREIRETAHNLMPDVLEKHDLREALALYCSKINDAGILQLLLQCDEAIPIDDPVTSLILYRIIQELVQNIVKHASATKAGIYILQYENKLAITVEDNGKGFEPDSIKKGMGLDNVRYRVKALHGEINISARPGHGTTIHIELEPEKLRSALR